MTADEREELELLRKSAARFICDPLERAFFELESMLERPRSRRLDSVMSTGAFETLARALLELKREVLK